MINSTAPCRIEIATQFDELERVRSFCEFVVHQFFAEDQRDDVLAKLTLAVNEAVANVIEHGHNEEGTGEIACEVTQDNDQLQFSILHSGAEFSGPTTDPTVDEPLECGMGLYLIQECSDNVSYGCHDDGRQYIRLTYNL